MSLTIHPTAYGSMVMARVRGKDTKPEVAVRKLVYSLGYRFRLHRTDLPGTPDLVFPRFSRVIFVHGCFWHGHHCLNGQRRPKANHEFWVLKISGNRERDLRNSRKLRRMGWHVMAIWECQIKNQHALSQRISRFLGVP